MTVPSGSSKSQKQAASGVPGLARQLFLGFVRTHILCHTTCCAFIRMNRPHEAREGTVLFPAFLEMQ